MNLTLIWSTLVENIYIEFIFGEFKEYYIKILLATQPLSIQNKSVSAS